MAKLKKLLIGALSMCMAVSMAACGNTGNGVEAENNKNFKRRTKKMKIKDRMLTEYVHKYTNEEGKTITYGMPLALSSYGMWYDNA